MSTIIISSLVVAILLIGVAWRFAPRNNQFAQFWIERTGRRASWPASKSRGRSEDGRTSSHG